jgi:hypothetical protein
MKFLFLASETDFFGDRNCKSTRKFEADELSEVILQMELFLKGCGYYVENLTYDIPSVGCRNYDIPEGEPF